MTTQGLKFSHVQDIGEIVTGHPQWAPNARGVNIIGEVLDYFRDIARLGQTMFDLYLAISRKWSKIATQLLWKANMKWYVIYRMVFLWCRPTPCTV